MMRKVLYVALALAALNAIVRAGSTSWGVVLGMVLSWAVFGYLVWRAWPAVRRDLSALRAVPRVPHVRFGRDRGDTL